MFYLKELQKGTEVRDASCGSLSRWPRCQGWARVQLQPEAASASLIGRLRPEGVPSSAAVSAVGQCSCGMLGASRWLYLLHHIAGPCSNPVMQLSVRLLVFFLLFHRTFPKYIFDMKFSIFSEFVAYPF